MKKIYKIVFIVYKTTLSVLIRILFAGGCRFTPTCSEYAHEALDKHTPLYATLLIVRRLSKCHPLGPSGHDPVPPVTIRT